MPLRASPAARVRSAAKVESCWWQVFHKRAQLKEHQRAEAGFRVAEQIAERVELLLHANGGAFLLLEAVAQQMKFVLEVGIGLLEARAILEELHEPLFFGTHRARRRHLL